MLCIKKSVYLSIFALFAVLFGSCIITSSDVSALADYTITVTDTTVFICDNSSSSLPHCSDYDYLLLSDFSDSNLNSFYSYAFYVNNNRYGGSVRPSGVSLLSISDNLTKIDLSSLASDRSFKATLTNTFGSPCPVCPTCPVIPDNPYDPKFDEIKQAILIIPATALVIYFFFCIYRMLLKGRE